MNVMTDTASLVSSKDVNGTEVYGKNGDHIGTIDHMMIDKSSGKVTYAVISFGGFLGLGEDHYPIPWDKLSYNSEKDGFDTDITESQVSGAPERTEDWYVNRDWEKRTFDYYGAPYYWI